MAVDKQANLAQYKYNYKTFFFLFLPPKKLLKYIEFKTLINGNVFLE